jgi:regulation of enolase protein 1 (concanavalin A-like superfamily)
MEIPGLPPLEWTHGTGEAQWESSVLTLTAAKGVDWTNDAAGAAEVQHRATSLSFVPEGDFQLAARVRVEQPRSTFDAGALTLWIDEACWAKLCFEWSPPGEATVVSVVTNEYSDDANSTVVDTDAVYLRISRTGPAFAFHSSPDGRFWRFVRLFRLHADSVVRAGFMAQAPLGDRCVAQFANIRYATRAPSDLRDGS